MARRTRTLRGICGRKANTVWIRSGKYRKQQVPAIRTAQKPSTDESSSKVRMRRQALLNARVLVRALGGAFLIQENVVQKKRIAQQRDTDQDKEDEVQDQRQEPLADQVAEISRNLKGIRYDGQKGYGEEQDEDKIIQDDRNRFPAQKQPDRANAFSEDFAEGGSFFREACRPTGK